METSITKQTPLGTEEVLLEEYSVAEHEQRNIDSANAKAVFSPEFIPFYCDVAQAFNLTHIESLVYGFIRFYTSTASNRFYFTDEQLGKITLCSASTAGRAVSRLKKEGILIVHNKIKAGGGKIRFIETKRLISGSSPDRSRLISGSEPLQKRGNKNKIKNNSLLKRIEYITSFGNVLPEDVKKEIRENQSLKRKYQHLL